MRHPPLAKLNGCPKHARKGPVRVRNQESGRGRERGRYNTGGLAGECACCNLGAQFREALRQMLAIFGLVAPAIVVEECEGGGRMPGPRPECGQLIGSFLVEGALVQDALDAVGCGRELAAASVIAGEDGEGPMCAPGEPVPNGGRPLRIERICERSWYRLSACSYAAERSGEPAGRASAVSSADS